MTQEEKTKRVVEIADRIHRLGTVYDRLPQEVITRKRHFKHLNPCSSAGRTTLS